MPGESTRAAWADTDAERRGGKAVLPVGGGGSCAGFAAVRLSELLSPAPAPAPALGGNASP